MPKPETPEDLERAYLREQIVRDILSSPVARELDVGRNHNHDALLRLAGDLWDWIAEIPAQFEIFGSDPYQQDAPSPARPPMDSIAITDGKEKQPVASISMKDDENVVVQVQPLDKKGNPVTDSVTYSIDNTGVATLAPSEDGYSVIVSGVAPGTASITITDGTLSTLVAVNIEGDTATALSATVGTPTAQDDASAPTPADSSSLPEGTTANSDGSEVTTPAPSLPGDTSVAPGPGADNTPAQVS